MSFLLKNDDLKLGRKRRAFRLRLGDLLALIKPPQTALLLWTGLSAYLLTVRWRPDLGEMLGMLAALLMAVAGCTALNMVIERDLDGCMERTCRRPLPAGRIGLGQAVAWGGGLSLAGLGLAFALDLGFGGVVAAGFAFDLGVYTLWLKRRTALSILFGGVAGGMPALAGRVLALGRVDLVGLLLAGAVLLWIPAHILTLAQHYAEDYRRAGIPVWPNLYGRPATRAVISIANLLNSAALTWCALLLQVHRAVLWVLVAMGLGLAALSLYQWIRPTERRNWLLFKLASVYMLVSSLFLALGRLPG